MVLGLKKLKKVFILLPGFLAFLTWTFAPAQETRPAPEMKTQIEPLSFQEEEEVQVEGVRATIPLEPGLRLNMDDCVKMALLNNKEVKMADYNVQTAEWKLKEAKPGAVPTVEYEMLNYPAPRDADNAVGSFFTADVTYGQRGKVFAAAPIYTFGKLSLAQELAKIGIGVEKEKKTEKQNEVVGKVKKLYYGILLAKDLRKLFKDAARHLEEEIEQRAASEEPSDPVELVRMKLFRFEVLSRLGKVEKDDYLAREGLRIQMSLPPGTEYELTEDHLEPVNFELKSFEEYLQLSRKFRPKSRMVDMGLRAKEAQYRLEKRQIAPNVGIGGFYEYGFTAQEIRNVGLTDDFNDPFNFQRAGVGVRVKGEFNYNTYKSKVKQLEAEYFKTAMGKEAADEGLELELKQSYLDVRQQGKHLELSRKAMQTARQFVFLTKSNLDIGVGDRKDYADALQAYLVAKGRFYEAVFNYNVAVASLEETIGGVGVIQ